MFNKKERIELHCHSKDGGKSAMHPGEIIKYLSEMGMPAFAITDESSILSFPEIEMVWETGNYLTRPIYGMEMIVSDECKDVYHVSVLIRNEEGKKALYKMISNNPCEDPHPIYSMSELLSNREGLLIGTGTDTGKIYRLVLSGSSDDEIKKELSIYDYVEVLPFERYTNVSKKIIHLADDIGLPIVAVSDARYFDEYGCKAIAIMNHWNGKNEDNNQCYFWSTEEMLSAFAYLSDEKAYEIVVENTHKIADMCEIVEVCPKENYYPSIPKADEIVRTFCMNALEQKYTDCKEKALDRLEWELSALKKTKMASSVLHMMELIEKTGLNAYEISFRGLSSSSIITYLLGMNEIDPLKYNLSAEMLYGFKQNKEIDIDISFPTERQTEAHRNLESLTGIQKVVYEGTVGTISDRSALDMIERYEGDNGVKYEEETKNKLIWCIGGNYKIRGNHSGALVVFPDACDDYESITPIIRIPGGVETTYFDYCFIFESFLKYDLLASSGLEKLNKMAVKAGISLASVPTDSEEVLELFKLDENGLVTACADLPEFQNEYARNLVALYKPNCFNDLVKISALAHGNFGTFGRKYEDVNRFLKVKGIGIKDLIATRDDVFDFNLSLGLDRETAFEIAEAVRKGIIACGRMNKSKAMKKKLIEAGAPEWYIWSCEQIRYLFPRSQAIGYIMMTMRMGWFKVHYPDIFSSVLKEYEEKERHI